MLRIFDYFGRPVFESRFLDTQRNGKFSKLNTMCGLPHNNLITQKKEVFGIFSSV